MRVVLVSASPRLVAVPSTGSTALVAGGVALKRQIEAPVLRCEPAVVHTVAELKRELAQVSETHEPVVVHFACALSDDGTNLLLERDFDQPPFPDTLDASQVGALFAAFPKTNHQLLLVFDVPKSCDFADSVRESLPACASSMALAAIAEGGREELAASDFWRSFYKQLAKSRDWPRCVEESRNRALQSVAEFPREVACRLAVCVSDMTARRELVATQRVDADWQLEDSQVRARHRLSVPENFVERSQFATLREWIQSPQPNLAADSVLILKSAPGIPGGTGKSMLAVALACAAADVYCGPHILLSLRGAERLEGHETDNGVAEAQMRTFVETFDGKCEQNDPRARFRQLCRLHRKGVLVVDDARDQTDVKALLPPAEAGWLVIVTTRAQRVDVDKERTKVECIGEMDANESLQLLIRRANMQDRRANEQECSKDLEKIAQLCGHIPLAITSAAQYLAQALNASDDAAQVVLELENNLGELEDAQFADEHRRRLFASLKLSFSAKSLSDGGRTLALQAASFPGHFSKQGLAVANSLNSGCKEDVISLWQQRDSLVREMAKDFRTLVDLGIIKKSDGKQDMFQVHDVVREYLRWEAAQREVALSESRKRVAWWCWALVCHVDEQFNQADGAEQAFKRWSEEMDTIVWTFESGVDVSVDEALVSLWLTIDEYRKHRRSLMYLPFHSTIALLERALEQNVAESETRFWIMHRLAHVHGLLFQESKDVTHRNLACSLADKIIASCKSSDIILRTKQLKSIIARWARKYNEANKLMAEVVEMSDNVSGYIKADAFLQRAICLCGPRNRTSAPPNDAIELFDRAVDGLTKFFGEFEDDVLWARIERAAALSKSADQKEQLEAREELMAVAEAYGKKNNPKHPNAVAAKYVLGNAFVYAGKFREAKEELEWVLAMNIEQQHENARETRDTRGHLAKCCVHMADWTRVDELLVEQAGLEESSDRSGTITLQQRVILAAIEAKEMQKVDVNGFIELLQSDKSVDADQMLKPIGKGLDAAGEHKRAAQVYKVLCTRQRGRPDSERHFAASLAAYGKSLRCSRNPLCEEVERELIQLQEKRQRDNVTLSIGEELALAMSYRNLREYDEAASALKRVIELQQQQGAPQANINKTRNNLRQLRSQMKSDNNRGQSSRRRRGGPNGRGTAERGRGKTGYGRGERGRGRGRGRQRGRGSSSASGASRGL